MVDVCFQSVAEMEGVTQGIRQTTQYKKVKIEEPGEKGKNAAGKKAKGTVSTFINHYVFSPMLFSHKTGNSFEFD
jgi:hypothetical protein